MAFFKQRDLEFPLDKHRKVKLGEQEIVFTHTKNPSNALRECTYLTTINSDGYSQNWAELPKASMISYNLQSMHQILTLNFFKFIDNLKKPDGKPDTAYINWFYQEVGKLNEEQLIQFLTNLEIQMTDTAEFNFYGAYQIDFSAMVSITKKAQGAIDPEGYNLTLSEFISSLNQGDVNSLEQAKQSIPEVFKSYRFIDYLIEQVKDEKALVSLESLRCDCDVPQWLDNPDKLDDNSKFEP